MLKLKKKIILLTLIFLAFFSLTSCEDEAFPPKRETKTLNAKAREKIGGDFIKLSTGYTHYKYHKGNGKRTVILVHGATIPMWTWDMQIEALTNAGYSVLQYDLIGKGFSDRPEIAYTREVYRKHLLELIKALEIETPVSLVGESFGGGVSAYFSAKHHDMVHSVCFVAPAVFSLNNLGRKLVKSAVGSKILRNTFDDIYEKNAAKTLKSKNIPLDPYLELFLDQFRYKGFERAYLSMFRNDGLKDLRHYYKTAGENISNVMLVWGEEDDTVSEKQVRYVEEVIPHLDLRIYEGIGHLPPFEMTKEFNKILLEFLEK